MLRPKRGGQRERREESLALSADVVDDAGLVVPAGDSDALAAAIRKLFEDDQLRDDYASRGLSRAEQHFCWNRCAERMEAYYRERIAAC